MRALLLAALPLFAACSERSSSESDSDNQTTSEENELFAWVKSMGGTIDPRLELSTGPDPAWNVRGLFALSPIEAGEELVYLPTEVQICNPTMCGLISELRQELVQKEKSKHWPYLKAMETHEIDYPNVWTDEERSLLVGLQPSDWTRHLDWYEWECWPSLREELGAEENSHPDDLTARALHLYVARITTVQSAKTAEYCFIPIYDAMNHRNGPELNTAWSSKGTSDVTISATKHIPEGGQLWNSFGEGAARMFRDYGFIEQNPTEWTIQAGDVTCTWTLSEQDSVLRVEWKDTSDQCHSVLQQHLATLPPVPEVMPAMKPGRVEMALKFRENYVNSIRFAIHALSRDREEL